MHCDHVHSTQQLPSHIRCYVTAVFIKINGKENSRNRSRPKVGEEAASSYLNVRATTSNGPLCVECNIILAKKKGIFFWEKHTIEFQNKCPTRPPHTRIRRLQYLNNQRLLSAFKINNLVQVAWQRIMPHPFLQQKKEKGKWKMKKRKEKRGVVWAQHCFKRRWDKYIPWQQDHHFFQNHQWPIVLYNKGFHHHSE